MPELDDVSEAVTEVTEKQKKILGFHALYVARHGKSPAVTEIAGRLGLSAEEVRESLRPLEERGIQLQSREDGDHCYVVKVSMKRHEWLPTTAKRLPQDRTVLQWLLKNVDRLIESSERAHSRIRAEIEAWGHGLNGKDDLAQQSMEQMNFRDIVYAAEQHRPCDEIVQYVEPEAFRSALLDLEMAVYVLQHRGPASVDLENRRDLDVFLAERMNGVLAACDGLVAVYRTLRAEIVEELSAPAARDGTAVSMSLPQMAEYIWGTEYSRRPKAGQGSRDSKHRLLRKRIRNNLLTARETGTRGVYRVDLEALKALRTTSSDQ